MQPLFFVAAFLALALAMVFAMMLYLAEEGRRWGFLYIGLWIASVGAFVGFAEGLDPRIGAVPVAWLIAHWAILRYGPALRRDGSHGWIRLAMRSARWLLTLVVVLLVIGIGEALPVLRDLDSSLGPHRATLEIVFGVLLAAGFALFMSGVIHLAVTSRSRADGELKFVDLRRAWRDGTWWSTVRMRRFLVIAGGVALGILAGASLAVVSAPPGIKLLVIVAVAYAIARTILARRRLQ